MAPLIVVSGPPGAGKSTVARLVAGAFPKSALVRGDDFFAFLAGGGFTVVYDGVVGPWFLSAFASATGLPEISYVVLLPSEEQCLARVANRSGHGFTDAEATRHMHRQFTIAELDDRHRLDEPLGADADAVAETVLRRFRRGELRFPVSLRPGR